MATKVTLREKVISKNRRSLYLDFYPAIKDKNGKETRREFLKMYVIDKPRTKNEREFNKTVREDANKICIARQTNLNKWSTYSDSEKKKEVQKEASKGCFVEYYEGIVNGTIARRTIKKKQKKTLKREGDSIWKAALIYLKKYTIQTTGEPTIRFCDLTSDFFNGFRDYLLSAESVHNKQGKGISQNSAAAYFTKVYSTLLLAQEKGFLKDNISDEVIQIEETETKREHLTLDELRKIVETECDVPLLKRAALFSALTGLRISDLKKLTWSKITFDKDTGRYRLQFLQKKAGRFNYTFISDKTMEFAGVIGEPDALVFDGLHQRYTSYHLQKLYNCAARAGITKKITFHSFRHTYATLQLSAGTDIYTLSKNMGHKNLKTTEIYAQIVDQKKIEAANAINL